MNSDGLTEFLAVVRSGSFTQAANVLGVSVAHVSRQVARLEERLDTKLLQRNTRSIHLTAPGKLLRKSSEKIADDLEAAFSEVSSAQRNLEGRLRIASLSGSFADHVVSPAVNELATQHPNIEIEIDFNPRQVDILSEGYDIAIRAGPMQSSGLIARLLSSRTKVAAASPEYLSKYGVPAHPSELKRHQCILTHSNSWRFSENTKPLDVAVSGRLRLNSGTAILDACSRGLGVAYMAVGGFENALSLSRLTPILGSFWYTEPSIHIVRPDRRFTPRRVEAAIEILEAFAKRVETKENQLVSALRRY
ncbi:LysR family transcriptional regulator [Lentilitoribacter sp. Alg239-R112]|uniref:LysR family transcriptional regulator n=1 Tax=Lentilitoribacter sp. Alg239-R112 TaxID=2305987 RepID=UPI0013A6B2FF|nr:LysR family transcriptional regulator [Lentilitoribacter sp. Alg239-R112]